MSHQRSSRNLTDMSMFREKLCQDLEYIMIKNTDFKKRNKHACCKCLLLDFIVYTQSVNKHDSIYHDVNKHK